MRILKLSDGRKLSYDVYGDPKGRSVIFSHGFSDSSLIRNPDEALTKKLGVKVIAADQPGVGESTPLKGRKMADWGHDMEELADHLGLTKFAVAGHSGGSPHALAIAHRMPQRVTKIVLASPVLPFDYPQATKLLRNKDLKLIVKLRRAPFLIKLAYKYGAKDTLKNIHKFVEKTAKDDPSDAQTYLRSPEQRQMFEQSFIAGFAQQGEGIYEMTMALWDWGFDPADIMQPATVFYGDADDIIDPKMPEQLASILPNSRTQIWQGAGHYGFVDKERWTEFLNAAKT